MPTPPPHCLVFRCCIFNRRCSASFCPPPGPHRSNVRVDDALRLLRQPVQWHQLFGVDCGRAQGRGRRGSSPRATGRHYVGLPRSVDDRTGGPFRNINRRVPASVFPPPLVGLTRARHGPHHARARDQMQLSLPLPLNDRVFDTCAAATATATTGPRRRAGRPILSSRG